MPLYPSPLEIAIIVVIFAFIAWWGDSLTKKKTKKTSIVISEPGKFVGTTSVISLLVLLPVISLFLPSLIMVFGSKELSLIVEEYCKNAVYWIAILAILGSLFLVVRYWPSGKVYE